MTYRREIDGLRAVAVVPVILFHAGFESFRGGFVGVDVFFVISGYLITSIIVAEIANGNFSIARFYERRARRILPALYVVMAFCVPLSWMWLLPRDMEDFSQSLVAVSVFLSNVLFWSETGYFATSSELKPLLHTWSLAVEEQFYVLFPLLLAFLWRFGKTRVAIVLTLILGISLAAAQAWSTTNPSAAFFLLPTRAWELAMGALLALALPRQPLPTEKTAAEILSLLGLLLIAWSIVALDEETPFPGLYALPSTAGTALIIAFGWPSTVTGKVLGSRVLVAIGLMSYSAYLWHQPLFAFARHRSIKEPTAEVLLALSALALVLAALSLRFVERPFRRSDAFSRRQVFFLGALGSVLFSVIGLAGYLTEGHVQRFSSIPYAQITGFPELESGYCFYSVDSKPRLPVGQTGLNCTLGNPGAHRQAVLFGDSFGGHYEPLWDLIGKDLDLAVRAVTTNWCHPSANDDFLGPPRSRAKEQCTFNRQYLVDHVGDFDVVILAANWGELFAQNKLHGSIDLIRQLAERDQLIIVMPVPKRFDVDAGRLFLKSWIRGIPFDSKQVPQSRDQYALSANAVLKQLADSLPNLMFVERDDLFAVDGVPSDVTEDGIPYTLDGRHISTYGSQKAAISLMASPTYGTLRQQIGLRGTNRSAQEATIPEIPAAPVP